ncbi:MAG: BTAD domain-containing putative transcriptional regulator [Marmoricola sp.]
MRVGILGAAEARLNGAAIDLGTRKQRALLAALAMNRGRPVQPDAIVDLLWGEAPPTAVTATLQGYVARLRRALEPDRPPRAPSEVLVTQQAGYALLLPDDALDAARFEAVVSAAHQELGTGVTPGAERLQSLFDDLSSCLGLWRGLPYTELEDAPAAQAERARLEELRAIALEDRAVAALGLGRHAMVAGELEVLTATYPLRERLWGLRALALTRSGRQADALEVLRQVRELLADELGLEPGAELRALQTAVLRQDPSLEWTAPRQPTAADSPESGPGVDPPRGPRSSQPRRTEAAWPLVGRDDQLAALVGLLEQSEDQPVFAVITGDPGIGKSRLCAELARAAQAEGTTVLVGRCSQDEGAPPLYPWAKVLSDLGHDLPVDSAAELQEDSGLRFRAWEQIARAVLEAAQDRHLLVILDDLHWADTSTLRVLRLLAESADSGRVMVVATWRHEPPPTGLLADVAETLARRHALRLQLVGLTVEESAEIVTSVANASPTADEADALRLRTDGNPFFLVEYARLAREGGDLTTLLDEEHPPAAVHDVLTRRIAVLPEATARTLRVASVLGRWFDVPTLAVVLDLDEDEVLDHLDAALAAGLVREDGVDRMRFAHALVCDTVSAGISRTRRGRMHARAAESLVGRPDREGEVARHWLSAGPQHAAQAWRAAASAAESARRVFAYDEALELLTSADEALAQDPDATPRDEYTVLVELAKAHQRTGDWVGLREVVHRAVAVALRVDDLERVLDAITLLTTNALWQAGKYGHVDEVVVSVLRAGLEQLPPEDSVSRCRAMVSLASEIYYSSTHLEREALCLEAVAMARRLEDPALLLWTLLATSLGVWGPRTAALRMETNAEAAAIARDLGAGIGLSTALTLQASAASELGLIDEMHELLAQAREQAERERHLYALLVLDGLEIPWLAMRGDFDTLDERITDMTSIHYRTSVPQSGDAVMGAILMRIMWGRQVEELRSVVPELGQVTVMPVEASMAGLLCRIGEIDRARDYLEGREIDLSPHWWFSTMESAMAAEASLYTGLRDLAADAYAALSEFSGQPACAGSGTSLGPVDAFLAMAAEATGERALATRHADDAARLCEEWRIPLAGEWFAEVRTTFGF